MEDLKKLYELYKLKWMLEHGYLLLDLVTLVQEYTDTMVGLTFEEAFKLWEEECGFGGELWVSYAEWLNNEYSAEGK